MPVSVILLGSDWETTSDFESGKMLEISWVPWSGQGSETRSGTASAHALEMKWSVTESAQMSGCPCSEKMWARPSKVAHSAG